MNLFEDVHGTQLSETAGTAERQHPRPDILLRDNDPIRPLTDYKLLDDIMMELAGKLKIQQLQGILADKWRPYMENLDTMYTDATCYESEMRYPTDAKLLWEGVEKSYVMMCELSSRLGLHRPRTKFLDVQKANLTYRKQRKHSRNQTRKITRSLLDLLGKILKEIREIERAMRMQRTCWLSERKVIWRSLRGCTASRRTTSGTTTAGKASPTG